MESLIASAEFLEWIETSLADDRNVLARSNQGTLLAYRRDGADLVVKAAMGNRAAFRLRQGTLNREREAYARMQGLAGIPRCHGMAGGRYLVLERVRGVPYRDADLPDREAWFARLLDIIRGFHDRGVSHGDLKSKDNLLVTDDFEPCVLDFGTAILFRDGFHPVNHRLFRYGCRLDLNAWVKHKYRGRYSEASAADRNLLDYSLLERLIRSARGRPPA